MINDVHTIIEFDKNDKWFVISEITYNNEKYNYLIKVTPDEKDFEDEFMVVKCFFENKEEVFKTITDTSLLKGIMPLLLPEYEESIKNNTLKELLK